MTTIPQNIAALERANAIRLGNAAIRRRIAALPQPEGRREAARLLTTNTTSSFESMRVDRLLTSVHRFGPTMTNTAMREIGCYTVGKRIRELTPRQRAALAEILTRNCL